MNTLFEDDPPIPGTPAECEQCGNDIVFVGPYWDHVGALKPRHPAVPQKAVPISGDRYHAAMERTRHTTLTPEQILIVLDLYLDRTRDEFAAFVALQGFRSALTGGADFESLIAYLKEGT